MRIAVTYEDGNVFGHFGHTERFKLYTVENGKVTDSVVISAVGSGHGALAGFLHACRADAVICGGIGGGAVKALAEQGIAVYGGVVGDADEAVQNLISGRLVFASEACCNHHDCGDHDCGDHDCGSHSCGSCH